MIRDFIAITRVMADRPLHTIIDKWHFTRSSQYLHHQKFPGIDSVEYHG